MSIRTLLIWIIVAGVLGAGVILAQAQKQAALRNVPEATSRTIGFDPSNTVAMARIGQTELDREFLERDPIQPDRWLIHWSANGMDQTWPAQTPKARGSIRTLATARALISPTDLLKNRAGEIVIRQQDGRSIRIEFDRDSAGGMTPIRVEERGSDGIATARWFGRLEKPIADAFVQLGMLDWRSKLIFDVPGSIVSQVDLEAGGLELSLERASNGWRINNPIGIHGQHDRIDELIQALLQVQTAEFVDGTLDDSISGLDRPIAKVTMGTADEQTRLTIGTRADVNGDTVYALVYAPSGTAMVTVETLALSKLTASVEPYISKVPAANGASKVSSLRVLGRDGVERYHAHRSMGNWTIDGQQVDSINQGAIERCVRVLTASDAQLVRVIEANAKPSELGVLELLDAGGQVLDRFEVAIDSNEAGMRLVLMRLAGSPFVDSDKQAHVIWAMNSEEAMATGVWLTAVAGKRVAQPAP